jgi:hypothetical protein
MSVVCRFVVSAVGIAKVSPFPDDSASHIILFSVIGIIR